MLQLIIIQYLYLCNQFQKYFLFKIKYLLSKLFQQFFVVQQYIYQYIYYYRQYIKIYFHFQIFLVFLGTVQSQDSNNSKCYDCLYNNGRGGQEQFYCVSDGNCYDYTEDNLDKCQNVEYHDLILNATGCCSDIQSEDDCLSPQYISSCLYCPEYTDPNTGEDVPGQCMYNNDTLNINKNCLTNPDITSQCSKYENCSVCAEDIVCGWCPSMGRCVTTILDDFPYPQPQYKCTNASTKICCDNYYDCETCSQNSQSVNQQVCNWCQISADEGKCLTADQIDQYINGSESYIQINQLGKQYCQDKCYMSAYDCGTCLKQSGCVWVENMQYSISGAVPPVTQMCTAGGSNGPKNTTIYYETTYTIPFTYSSKDYYYLTCSMTTKTLDSLIIGIVVGIVCLVIIVYVIYYIVRKVRYQKALIEAAKKAITDEDRAMLCKRQEDFDLNEFMFEVEGVSWYDE